MRKRSEGRERRAVFQKHEEGIYSYMTATLWQCWPWMFGILGMKIENGINYLWLALKMYWSINIFHKDLTLRKAAETCNTSSTWSLCFRESKMHLLLLFLSFLQLITENAHIKGRKAAYLLLLSTISKFKNSQLDLTETVQRRRRNGYTTNARYKTVIISQHTVILYIMNYCNQTEQYSPDKVILLTKQETSLYCIYSPPYEELSELYSQLRLKSVN